MKWQTISDSDVRHVWCDPEDDADEITVEPTFYADAGTPITEDAGDDLLYVRTEIID